MGNIQEMLGSLDLESQRRVPVELGPKFLSSGYHLADDHTQKLRREPWQSWSQTPGSVFWVMLYYCTEDHFRNWNWQLLSLGRAAAEINTDKVSKQTGNEEGICPSLFFGFQFHSIASYWQNLKGSQLVKNKFCFQGSTSGITKQNMKDGGFQALKT